MLLLVLGLQSGRLQRVPNGGLYDVDYGIKKYLAISWLGMYHLG